MKKERLQALAIAVICLLLPLAHADPMLLLYKGGHIGLGVGYDSLRGVVRDQCATLTAPQTVLAGGPRAFRYHDVQTHEEVRRSKSSSLSGGVSLGSLKLSGDQAQEESYQFNSYTRTILLKVEITTGTKSATIQSTDRLPWTRAGWLAKCGDRYVRSIVEGASLDVIIQIDRESTATSSSDSSGAGGTYGDKAELKTKTSSLSTSMNKSASTKVVYSTSGGLPRTAKLPPVVRNYEDLVTLVDVFTRAVLDSTDPNPYSYEVAEYPNWRDLYTIQQKGFIREAALVYANLLEADGEVAFAIANFSQTYQPKDGAQRISAFADLERVPDLRALRDTRRDIASRQTQVEQMAADCIERDQCKAKSLPAWANVPRFHATFSESINYRGKHHIALSRCAVEYTFPTGSYCTVEDLRGNYSTNMNTGVLADCAGIERKLSSTGISLVLERAARVQDCNDNVLECTAVFRCAYIR